MKDLKLDFLCLSIITIKLHSQIISFFIVVLHHFTITITHNISIIKQHDRGGKGSKFNWHKQCGNSVVIRIVIAQWRDLVRCGKVFVAVEYSLYFFLYFGIFNNPFFLSPFVKCDRGWAGGCHLCANGSMHYNMLFWIVVHFLPNAHNSNWILCRLNNEIKLFRLDPIMISTYLQIDILAEISSLGRKNGPLSQSLPSALIGHKKRYYSAPLIWSRAG